MIFYPKDFRIKPDAAGLFDEKDVMAQAEKSLRVAIPHITDAVSPHSPGTIHDYYSDADYWWPDETKPDGLPFVMKDGQTNPDNFVRHRLILRQMRNLVSSLACGYQISGREDFAERAVGILKEFFLDERTRMHPNLEYAQAIQGICKGRSIGVIDTLHLVDVPFAIEAVKHASCMDQETYQRLQDWFAQYLGWMLTSRNGIGEMIHPNNHSICYFVQVAAFASFTDNEQILQFCRDQFKTHLIGQLKSDGTFPKELHRTKPYSYCAFVLDNFITLCYLLSTPDDNLWAFRSPEGSCCRKALDFMMPYLVDKASWPYPPDIMHFEAFPVRYSFLVFAGLMLGDERCLALYRRLPLHSDDEEARRNMAIQYPMLWV